MPRHAMMNNLDLDEELDDFDGAEDEYEEELSPEDKQQMREGTIAVRERLSPSVSASTTDTQIQEALWHYYYDIDKSVGYLTGLAKPKEPKVKEEKKKNTPASPCAAKSQAFSVVDFFKDSPWLQVPLHRQAYLAPPIQPRMGLLGGASDDVPKLSKLQALAAARKKKAQDQRSSEGSGIEKPMSGLKLDEEGAASGSVSKAPAKSTRSFPIRKRKDSNPHEKTTSAPPERDTDITMETSADIPDVDQAAPSAFASTMFGTATAHKRASSIFTLPYNAASSPVTTNPFAGPSPDDVVIAAQSQSKALKTSPKLPAKTHKEMKADQIAVGVETMKLDDTPHPKSKNLDVLKEYEKSAKKNSANFVVIGHVDAGKSTLMGRLLYDLKMVDQRTLDRYKKEAEQMGKASFALAWVLDQGSEERARGVTIDIATNNFQTEKTAFTILDAPGHQDFVPNMIAGAAQADFAVLVIDASTGSFESGLKGQTKEHALLVRSMGVQRIIVAVNKLDSVDWSEDRFTEIQQQVSSFLTTAGFLAKNIAFVPCSGLLGDNITRKSTEIAAAWYKGATLVEELDSSEPTARALDKPLRITIGDIFRGGVQNPLSISGRIEAGSLQMGDALLVQPANQKCFVKSLEIDNETVDWAVAGQIVTVNLAGIEEEYLHIGDVICPPGKDTIVNVKEFTIKILAFEFLTPMAVDVHRGRLHVAGQIGQLLGVLDKGSGESAGKKKPRIIKPGQLARVKVELESSVPLEKGARVVLRSDGQTVAAGLLE